VRAAHNFVKKVIADATKQQNTQRDEKTQNIKEVFQRAI